WTFVAPWTIVGISPRRGRRVTFKQCGASLSLTASSLDRSVNLGTSASGYRQSNAVFSRVPAALLLACFPVPRQLHLPKPLQIVFGYVIRQAPCSPTQRRQPCKNGGVTA